MPSPCLFCEIIAGRLPGEIVYQDDLVTAFRDRFPRAPVHILIVPNRHIDSASMLCAEDEMVIGHLILTARQLAVKMKIDQTGFRLVINTGPDAGQSVHHLHLHLLGGKSMPLMGG